MMERNFTQPAEELAAGAAEYVDLKIDEAKLKAARGLSVTFGKLLFSLTLLSLGTIVLTALAFGFVLLLGKLLGSYALGAFIVAGFFALVMLAVFLLRRKLFVNGFVRMFVRLFSDSEIRNIEELEAACDTVSEDLRSKGGDLAAQGEKAKAFYTPANIVATGIRNASGVIPFDRMVLLAIRALKRRMS